MFHDVHTHFMCSSFQNLTSGLFLIHATLVEVDAQLLNGLKNQSMVPWQVIFPVIWSRWNIALYAPRSNILCSSMKTYKLFIGMTPVLFKALSFDTMSGLFKRYLV